MPRQLELLLQSETPGKASTKVYLYRPRVVPEIWADTR